MGDKFGIWCEVWGGVTGSRKSWLTRLGTRMEFDSFSEAADEAAQLTNNVMSNPYRKANFRYTARRTTEMTIRKEHDLYVVAKQHGWEVVMVHHTPAAQGTAPGAVVLCKVNGGEWATYQFNSEDGGFYHGHYHRDVQHGIEEWFERATRAGMAQRRTM